MGSEANNKLETFLAREFDVISNAHHEAKSNSVTFFRYYLLVMALPFGFLALLRDGRPMLDDVTKLSPGLGLLLVALSVIGLMLAWHHSNLRIDSMLYARVCNGIRRYYYTSFEACGLKESEVRVLPKDPGVPSFNLFKTPLPWVYITINSLYACVGSLSLSQSFVWSGLVAAISLTLHLTIFLCLWRTNERRWGASAMGVDLCDAA